MVVGVSVNGVGVGAVLGAAAALAGALGGAMMAVHVEERSALVDANLAAGAASAALMTVNTEISDRCHLDCELAMADRSVEWSFEVRAGDPAGELLGVAREVGAAFLVVGRAGHRRTASRLRKASTVELLVARSKVPVVVVPPPA
jgi:nucleotide-binding universal stress UspA family protein